MNNNLLVSKKRLIPCLICFLLSIAFLCCGLSLILFSNKKSAFATAEPTAEFKVLPGAAIRYNEETPGIRFQASVNKAQYDAWSATLEEGQSIGFHFTLKVENLKGEDGQLIPNDTYGAGVGFYDISTNKNLRDISKWNFASNGDFVFSSAIFLNRLWNGTTPKTSEQLFNMFGEAEFSVYSVHAHVLGEDLQLVDNCEAPLGQADNSANTSRTMRSVALAIYAQNKDADSKIKTDIQKSYLYDKLGFSLNLFDVSEANFYDLSADKVELEIKDLINPITASGVKVYVGAREIDSSNVVIDGAKLTISGIKEILEKSSKYVVLVDAGNVVYSFSNVTAVTKIITTKEEFKEIFVLKALITNANTGNETYKITESFTAKDGTVYTQDFYGNSNEVFRGHYVLGADLDFSGRDYGEDPLDFYHIGTKIAVESSNLNGLYGFGGIFDGNGHTINKVSFVRAGSTPVSGLFGALAYGATVKNLAVTNVSAYSFAQDGNKVWGEPQRPSTIIATNVGDTSVMTAETESYLKAKYGTTDTVLMQDMYVSLTNQMTTDANADPFYKINGSQEYHNFWTFTKKNGGDVYGMGGIGLVYSLDAKTTTMRNVVLDMPNPGLLPSSRGRGFVTTSLYENEQVQSMQGAFENCYLISAPSNLTTTKGHNLGVGAYGTVVLDNGENAIKASNNWADAGLTGATVGADGLEYTYEDIKIYKEGLFENHFTLLASNDYDAIVGATSAGETSAVSVYQGLDGSGNWEYKLADGETVMGNSYVMRAKGVVRYDSLTEMKSDANLSKLNPENWDVNSSAVAWKNSNGAGLEVTLNVAGNPVSSLGIGDVATVTVKYQDADVTSNAIITTDDESVLAISGNQITCSSGVAKLYVAYTVGEKTFTKTFSIGIDKAYTNSVYVSADEGVIKGSQTAYSAFYAYNSDTKNYELTTLDDIYKSQAGESAVLDAVYVPDANEGYVKLNTVTDGLGNKTLSVDDANTITPASYVLSGNNGAVKLPNAKIVTAVITDEVGFNYIPTDANTRSGYYVLANDFECVEEQNAEDYDGDTMFTNKLNVKISASASNARSEQIGYSFGARVVPSLTDSTGDTGFNGTFDGLGHTINNMEVGANGLLGVYAVDNGLACTIKNVKFTNFRSRNHYASAYSDGVYTASTISGNAETILCRINYTDGNSGDRIPEGKTINFENVVLEMAQWGFQNTSRYYRGASPYYNNGADYNNVETCNRFSFISYGNANARSFRNARVIFKDVILSYDVGYGAYSDYGDYQGGVLVSFKYNNGVANASTSQITLGYDASNWYYGALSDKTIKGLYIIQTAHKGENQSAEDLGKVVALGAWTEGGVPTIVYTNNDYQELTGDTTGWKDTGWYQGVDASGNYIHSKETTGITTYLKACNLAGASNPTNIVRTKGNAFRYDSYAEMLGAGVTSVGGFEITATGANWN